MGAEIELPRWRCHKIVHAAKIVEALELPGGARVVVVEFEERRAQVAVDLAYFQRHRPEPGGYYVQYADGYESYSPAKAFEEGYTRVQEFTNHSKRRLWSEDECRAMLNAALLYLADQAGGRLELDTDQLMAAAMPKAGIAPGVAMSLSDDDKVLTITRMAQQ